MLIGCYTLNIYCHYGNEIPGNIGLCNTNRPWNEGFPWQYTGHTESECLREARKDGWKINKKTGKAVCPDCMAKGRR